jgi:hypothetical protein
MKADGKKSGCAGAGMTFDRLVPVEFLFLPPARQTTFSRSSLSLFHVMLYFMNVFLQA